MLNIRLIPTILLKDGRMVKTKQFGVYKDVGNPKTVARIYDAQRADELIFLDITATVEGRRLLLEVIRSVAEECFMPLTVGGGIAATTDAREILKNGADKIAINTAAVNRPEFLDELAETFGRSTVVASIDYKQNVRGDNEVFTHRGTRATGLDPISWALEAERRGAGEIFLTCIDREGMMIGYDLETVRSVAEIVHIPVIAHGGVGTVQDLVDGIVIGKASAVAAASIFHFTDQSVFKAHAHMKEKGLPVRLL